VKKPYVPGQKARMRVIESEYYLQLREKQKAKRYYGILETQFSNYYKKAVKKKGITGEILLQLIETRLDNVLYLLGFATSRSQSKQLIVHGHVKVNGKKVDIPSFQVKPDMEISIAEGSKEIPIIMESKETAGSLTIPEWLTVRSGKSKGKSLKDA
jgi:small subunit ribosomal protein S4